MLTIIMCVEHSIKEMGFTLDFCSKLIEGIPEKVQVVKSQKG